MIEADDSWVETWTVETLRALRKEPKKVDESISEDLGVPFEDRRGSKIDWGSLLDIPVRLAPLIVKDVRRYLSREVRVARFLSSVATSMIRGEAVPPAKLASAVRIFLRVLPKAIAAGTGVLSLVPGPARPLLTMLSSMAAASSVPVSILVEKLLGRSLEKLLPVLVRRFQKESTGNSRTRVAQRYLLARGFSHTIRSVLEKFEGNVLSLKLKLAGLVYDLMPAGYDPDLNEISEILESAGLLNDYDSCRSFSFLLSGYRRP